MNYLRSKANDRIVLLVFLIATQLSLPGAAALLVGEITNPRFRFPLDLLNQRLPLDLNFDGAPDTIFTGGGIANAFLTDNTGEVEFIIVQDPPPNIGGEHAALPVGYVIGPVATDASYSLRPGEGPFLFDHEYTAGSDFMTGEPLNITQVSLCVVQGCETWFRGQDAYIGFRITEDDGDHYGYLQVEGNGNRPGGRLTALAYETVAFRPVTIAPIPEPATTLSVSLALASALGCRRRRSSVCGAD